LAVICRARDPYVAILLSLAARIGCMPSHIDITGIIGGDRPAAIETRCLLDDVPFRLETSSAVVQSSVEHGRRTGRGSRLRFVRAHPGNVNTTGSADRHMSAADIADSNCATGTLVDLDRSRESSAVSRPDVKNVPGTRIAGEIDHMNRSVTIHH